MKKKSVQSVTEKPTITKERARRNIAQWLYVNDGKYANKLEWREALIHMIDFNIDHIK